MRNVSIANFSPNALPRIMSCTRGKIIDASISAGERKNLRISRSTMANDHWFMAATLVSAA